MIALLLFIGNVFRSIAGKQVCYAISNDMDERLFSIQREVGVPGSCEVANLSASSSVFLYWC